MARLEWFTKEGSGSYTAHTKFLKCNTTVHLTKGDYWNMKIKRRDEVWINCDIPSASNVSAAMQWCAQFVSEHEYVEPKILTEWQTIPDGHWLLVDIAGIQLAAMVVHDKTRGKYTYTIAPTGLKNPIRQRLFSDENDALKTVSAELNEYLNLFVPYKDRHDFVTV